MERGGGIGREPSMERDLGAERSGGMDREPGMELGDETRGMSMRPEDEGVREEGGRARVRRRRGPEDETSLDDPTRRGL